MRSLSLETGDRRVLIEGARHVRYVSTGRLLYVRGNTILGVTFDVRRLEVTGSPFALLEGVRTQRVAQVALSSSGTLVYVPRSLDESTRRPVWVNRQGETEQLIERRDLGDVMSFAGASDRLSLSPDGDRLALEMERDVWILELSRGTLTRLTSDAAREQNPIWTPDGQRVTFRAGESTLLWVPAEGRADPEVLLERENQISLGSGRPMGKPLPIPSTFPRAIGISGC